MATGEASHGQQTQHPLSQGDTLPCYGMLLGVDEADSDYWDAVDDEGVAFGNYLVARLHWCQCRRGKDS